MGHDVSMVILASDVALQAGGALVKSCASVGGGQKSNSAAKGKSVVNIELN